MMSNREQWYLLPQGLYKAQRCLCDYGACKDVSDMTLCVVGYKLTYSVRNIVTLCEQLSIRKQYIST